MAQEERKKDLHEQLRRSMEKEIRMMREILANMHQEELTLTMKDRATWNKVLEERSQMILRLSALRIERIEATEKLEKFAAQANPEKKLPLDQLLPPADADSFELLSMRDQLMALIERMNSQNSLNEQLYIQIEHPLDLSSPLSYRQTPQNQAAPQKKKASLATYPRKTVN